MGSKEGCVVYIPTDDERYVMKWLVAILILFSCNSHPASQVSWPKLHPPVCPWFMWFQC